MNSKKNSENFDEGSFKRSQKKFERKQARIIRRQKRRAWRQKIQNKIKGTIVQTVTVTKDGVIIVISYIFQKEIILATTIFISSWVNFQESRKLQDLILEQKVEIARIEARLGLETEQLQPSFIQRLRERVNWLALGVTTETNDIESKKNYKFDQKVYKKLKLIIEKHKFLSVTNTLNESFIIMKWSFNKLLIFCIETGQTSEVNSRNFKKVLNKLGIKITKLIATITLVGSLLLGGNSFATEGNQKNPDAFEVKKQPIEVVSNNLNHLLNYEDLASSLVPGADGFILPLPPHHNSSSSGNGGVGAVVITVLVRVAEVEVHLHRIVQKVQVILFDDFLAQEILTRVENRAKIQIFNTK